ncbi:hypothetical protein CTAYLR_007226 [Chrysophaeum taylorii]|uniref:EF-hand domain-containing protein n=1 Tax=Chrysophaeum taylorii TaxID=2483200 RepID=A0AAD7UAI4_9STRA|nr:hypothetical protein CTAYLR_007226 [Chrysophaeum taylorii]
MEQGSRHGVWSRRFDEDEEEEVVADETQTVPLEEWWSLTDDRVRRIFKGLDLDQDGKISFEAVSASLRRYGMKAGGPSFANLCSRLDADASNDLDETEFVDAVRAMMLERLFSRATPESTTKGGVEVVEYSDARCERRQVDGAREAADISPRSSEPWVRCRWVDAHGELVLKCLAIKFGFHPLALEDALSPHQRPKVERFPNHILFVLPQFTRAIGDELPAHFSCASRRRWETADASSGTTIAHVPYFATTNVCIFLTLTLDTVVTFSPEKEDDDDAPAEAWWSRRVRNKLLSKSYTKLREADATHLTYEVLDALVDSVFPAVRAYRAALVAERRLIRESGYSRELLALSLIKADLEHVVRISRPLLRVVNHIIEDDEVLAEVVVELRDVRDNVFELEEDLQALLEMTAAIEFEVEKYFALRQDKTIFALTVVTAIFLPLQFLTGVFGMNFAVMPDTRYRYGYYIFLGMAVAYFVAVTIAIRAHFLFSPYSWFARGLLFAPPTTVGKSE